MVGYLDPDDNNLRLLRDVALGAQRVQVRVQVLGRGMLLVGAGVVVGPAASVDSMSVLRFDGSRQRVSSSNRASSACITASVSACAGSTMRFVISNGSATRSYSSSIPSRSV